MGPAGAIDLPGRDKNAAQRRHRQHAFLTAAAQGAPQHRQGAQGAVIRGGIGSMGIAPVIDRQSRLLHVFSRHMGQQLFQQIAPAIVQTLGIDPVVQHIGEENFRGDVVYIIQFFGSLQRGPGIARDQRNLCRQHILGRHMAVKIAHKQAEIFRLILQKGFHLCLRQGIPGHILFILRQNGSF